MPGRCTPVSDGTVLLPAELPADVSHCGTVIPGFVQICLIVQFTLPGIHSGKGNVLSSS